MLLIKKLNILKIYWLETIIKKNYFKWQTAEKYLQLTIKYTVYLR